MNKAMAKPESGLEDAPNTIRPIPARLPSQPKAMARRLLERWRGHNGAATLAVHRTQRATTT